MSFDYNWKFARKDVLAGLTVAAISLPQAMAYALIAGVDPRFGLYSAIVVTLVASIFGSSSHLINGPTNAISLVVFSALAFFDPDDRLDAYQALFLLGIMVGIIQILIGVFKLGDLTRYISESVVIGFMAGAGLLIAVGQIANFFGLHDKGTGHQHVLLRLWNTVTQGGPVNFYALGVGAGTIALVLLLRLLVRKFTLPQIEMLTALIVASGIAAYFGWSIPSAHGKTFLSVVGTVPASLPAPHIPDIKWHWISDLSSSAFAIAFLGLLEALAIAKSIAHQTGQKLDYNKQVLAEGLANLTGGFFQSLPGSGSLTRSAINHQAGASTRASGVYAAVAVAIVVLIAAPLARFIPKAALAGLLFVIAVRLVDWKRLRYAVRASWYDAVLVFITAFSAVFITVEFSILIGVALSIVLFVPRAARLRASELLVTPEGLIRERFPDDPPTQDLLIYDLEGELFFGAAPELDRYFDEITQRTQNEGIRYVVLRVKRTRNPDVVFLERLEQFLRESDAQGVTILLAGVRSDFSHGLSNLRFGEWLPSNRVFYEEDEIYSATLKAVRHAYDLLGKNSPNSGSEFEVIEGGKKDLYYLV
ncbi:MAG: SulP family inorganic anion transporter [Methylacidiphilales bacterium]|nr:SulP family inorganic anion transporter [Candidatus Methylacidiphilales bacterium]